MLFVKTCVMSGLVACCSVSVRVDGMCLDQEKEGMEQTLTEKGGQCFPCLPKQPVFVVCCLFWGALANRCLQYRGETSMLAMEVC